MRQSILSSLLTLAGLGLFACGEAKPNAANLDNLMSDTASTTALFTPPPTDDTVAIATFGNGCFWCTEAVFQELKGVSTTISGYSGGTVKNPAYREVCNGTTGHAEVLQITYNPQVISFDELLEVFFMTHDPTTLNRQGNDVGTQYRSAVFYHDVYQKERAEYWTQKLNKEQVWPDPIVTEITKFDHFYPAEDYHQEYYNLHGEAPYCRFVITPKVDKFRKVFKEKLK